MMKERGRQKNVLHNTGQRRPRNLDLLLCILDVKSWDGGSVGARLEEYVRALSRWLGLGLFQTSSDRLQYQEPSGKGWS